MTEEELARDLGFRLPQGVTILGVRRFAFACERHEFKAIDDDRVVTRVHFSFGQDRGQGIFYHAWFTNKGVRVIHHPPYFDPHATTLEVLFTSLNKATQCPK